MAEKNDFSEVQKLLCMVQDPYNLNSEKLKEECKLAESDISEFV